MNKAYMASLTDRALQGKTGHEIDPKLEANIAAIWKEVEEIGDPVDSELIESAPAKKARK